MSNWVKLADGSYQESASKATLKIQQTGHDFRIYMNDTGAPVQSGFETHDKAQEALDAFVTEKLGGFVELDSPDAQKADPINPTLPGDLSTEDVKSTNVDARDNQRQNPNVPNPTNVKDATTKPKNTSANK